MPKKILAADIGGTSSRFAAFESKDGEELRLVTSTWLKTADAATFAELLTLLRESTFPLQPEDADMCVIAIAGPIERGVYVKPPLIPWEVDLKGAQRDFGIRRFALVNDFLVQAFACRSPIGRKAELIIHGSIDEKGAVACIGAGTGLGKSFLLPDGRGGYVGGSSEGGHTNFAPENEREFEFAKFLCKQYSVDYATWNHIVSGIGLRWIHEFLTGEQLDPKDVASRFETHPETLEWASRFYGRVCRNFALETMAFGGVYIAGGVAAKNPQLVKSKVFRTEFHHSFVHRKVLEIMPVFLNDNEESGLWGAGLYGAQMLRLGA